MPTPKTFVVKTEVAESQSLEKIDTNNIEISNTSSLPNNNDNQEQTILTPIITLAFSHNYLAPNKTTLSNSKV